MEKIYVCKKCGKEKTDDQVVLTIRENHEEATCRKCLHDPAD